MFDHSIVHGYLRGVAIPEVLLRDQVTKDTMDTSAQNYRKRLQDNFPID